MMTWRIGVATLLAAATLTGAPAYSCVPLPPEPMLAGESEAAYRVRAETLQREREAKWSVERQAGALDRAETIFIARSTIWSPSQKPRYRNGLLLPPRLPNFSYPTPSYYKPIAWFRGVKSTDLFQLRTDMTSCGPMSVGDTTNNMPGDLFVFFAPKGPIRHDTVIDAIALDKVTDPALLEFVSRHRGKPVARPALSSR